MATDRTPHEWPTFETVEDERRLVTMERTCQVQLLAEAAGTPVPIDADRAANTARQVGGHGTGWFQAQPLFDWALGDQPDLLDE